LFQPFNIFLAAKGFGKSLRNIAIILCVFNIVVSYLMISHYGLVGAAYGVFLTYLMDFLLHLYYYLRRSSLLV
jgi:Na+-driven multidrug efflux pump